MARSSRRGRNKKVNSTPIIIGVLVILVAVLASMLFFKPEARSATPKPFNISQYRQDGSRFASTGNRYVLEGKVESIETRGDNRMLAVSIRGNKRELLPLLVLGSKPLQVNITRGDTFIFEVSCRTGRDSAGNEVKGILVVNDVKTK